MLCGLLRSRLIRVAFYLLLIPLIIRGLEHVFVNYLPSQFIFDSAKLQIIVKDSINSLSIDASASEIMESVHAKLQEEYPGYISDLNPDDWVFNNAGNAMGTMIILHASLTEYLIFFGSSVGTEGHTGTHFANDYFTILYGEELAGLPNATKPERYLPGDQHLLPYGVRKQYRMPEGTFALELAQGYIPTMLPFGMIEVLTSTFDFATLYKTVKLTGIQIVKSLLMGKL